MDAANFQYGSQFRRCQLEGILTDCARVYEVIMSSGVTLNNKENEIRDILTDYFEDDDYKADCTTMVKNFQVDHEVPEGLHGRVDIRFLPVNPYEGQKAYFIIECKRLDGCSHLNKEYVEHGIKRFKTTDKYSTPLGVNGMMGFLVKPLDVPVTCGDINTHLPVDEQLTAINNNAFPGCYDFESSLNAPSGMITLLHLWVDISSNMKFES